jgi:hypothetical protein
MPAQVKAFRLMVNRSVAWADWTRNSSPSSCSTSARLHHGSHMRRLDAVLFRDGQRIRFHEFLFDEAKHTRMGRGHMPQLSNPPAQVSAKFLSHRHRPVRVQVHLVPRARNRSATSFHAGLNRASRIRSYVFRRRGAGSYFQDAVVPGQWIQVVGVAGRPPVCSFVARSCMSCHIGWSSRARQATDRR